MTIKKKTTEERFLIICQEGLALISYFDLKYFESFSISQWLFNYVNFKLNL